MPENPFGTSYAKQVPVAGNHTLRSDTAKSPSVDKIINTVTSTLSIISEEQTVEFGSVDFDTANSVVSRLEETSGLRLAIYTISHFKYAPC